MARVEIIGFAKFKQELEKSVLDIVKDVEDTVYQTARANTPVLTGNANIICDIRAGQTPIKHRNFGLRYRYDLAVHPSCAG